MSIEQSVGRLHLFDLLAALVPGAVFLIVLSSIFSAAVFPSIIGNIGVWLVLSYVFGQGIQEGLTLIGKPPSEFEALMQVSEGESESKIQIAYTEIERNFHDLCLSEFELSDGFQEYDRLFDMILSYLETKPASRGLRFQAIFSFFWAMEFVSIITVLLGILGFAVAFLIPFWVNQSWELLWIIGFGILGAVIFRRRRIAFGQDFVEYVIADFYNYKVTSQDAR